MGKLQANRLVFFTSSRVQKLRCPTKCAPLTFRLASRHSAIPHSPSTAVFKLGRRPRPPERGGLEDSSSNYKHIFEWQL